MSDEMRFQEIPGETRHYVHGERSGQGVFANWVLHPDGNVAWIHIGTFENWHQQEAVSEWFAISGENITHERIRTYVEEHYAT